MFFTACSLTENESETVSTTAITDENGAYETVSNHKSSASDESTGSTNPADNEVMFESMSDSSEKDIGHTYRERLTTTKRSIEDIQPASDADGWVNKWY